MRLNPLRLPEELNQLTVPSLLTPTDELRRLQHHPRTLTVLDQPSQLEDRRDPLLDDRIRRDQCRQRSPQLFRAHPHTAILCAQPDTYSLIGGTDKRRGFRGFEKEIEGFFGNSGAGAVRCHSRLDLRCMAAGEFASNILHWWPGRAGSGLEAQRNISREVGCSLRLAGEARPGFCRECNRRRKVSTQTKPPPVALPAGSWLPPGPGEGSTRPDPTTNQARPQPDSATPSALSAGPPEAQLTLTFTRPPPQRRSRRASDTDHRTRRGRPQGGRRSRPRTAADVGLARRQAATSVSERLVRRSGTQRSVVPGCRRAAGRRRNRSAIHADARSRCDATYGLQRA